jgi:hypothetical protein
MVVVLHKTTQEDLMGEKRWYFMMVDVVYWKSEKYGRLNLITDQGLQSLDAEISSLT